MRALVAGLGGGLSFAITALVSAQEQPEPPIALPPVIVTAPARLPGAPLPLSHVPGSVQVIPGEEIRQSGAPSIQDVLTRQPGVTLKDEQGNSQQMGLSLRGFEASPVTGLPQGLSVFLDGVRINEPDVEQINFDLLPMEDIERIEVIRGSSAIFGRNTLAGAVNIITRRGTAIREAVAEISGGSFGRQKYRVNLGGSEGPFDYYVAGTLLREDGWRDMSESRLGKALGKLGYRGDTTDVSLSFQYAQNRIEQAGSIPFSDLRQGKRTENFTSGDFFRPVLNFGILNLTQDLGSSVSLKLNAFGRQLETEQFNVNIAGENTRTFSGTTSAGGTVQLNHEASILGRHNVLILGVDYVHHNVSNTVFMEQNSNSLTSCIADAIAAGLDPAAACPLKNMSTRIFDTQDAVGPFVQDTVDLAKALLLSTDSLVLTVGGRWDWLRHHIVDKSPPGAIPSTTGTHTFDRFNPRVGINYNLSKDYEFYFSYSQGFRAPAFLELTCASAAAACPGLQAGSAPDPPLKAVKATNYEVGFRAQPTPWLAGELSLFRTDVSDDILSVSPTGTTAVFFSNIGDTRRQGVELGLRGKWQALLEAYANYTYTEATFQNDVTLFTPRLTPGCAAPPCTEFVRVGHDLPLIPRHRLNAGLDLHVTRWLTVSFAMSYAGTQRLRGDEANVEAPLKDYVVLRGGLSARWKALTGFVWVNNLLNSHYETFGTFAANSKLPGAPVERFLSPAPPINVLAGLSYRF